MRDRSQTTVSATSGDRSKGPGNDADAPFSIGTYLRQQRDLRGISIEDLSVRTRIPVRSLERMEAGAFDGPPDGFVRGFVRSVAEGLGLDPDDTLVRMLAEPVDAEGRGVALRAPAAAWGLVALLLLVLIGAGFALRSLISLGDTGPGETEIVQRRDPVRELADAHTASGFVAPSSSVVRESLEPVLGEADDRSAAVPAAEAARALR